MMKPAAGEPARVISKAYSLGTLGGLAGTLTVTTLLCPGTMLPLPMLLPATSYRV